MKTAARINFSIPNATQNLFKEIFNPFNYNQSNQLNDNQFNILQNTAIDFQADQQIDCIYTFNETELPEVFKKLAAYRKKGYWAVGYVAYDAQNHFLNPVKNIKNIKNIKTLDEPLIYFKIFEPPNYFKNKENKENNKFFGFDMDEVWAEFQHSFHTNFVKNIDYIQSLIKAGDVYQINYTHLFKQLINPKFNTAEILNYHASLQKAQHYYYSFYLNMDDLFLGSKKLPDMHVLSHSPELFFAYDGRHIFTQPMKGTAKRDFDPIIDAAQKHDLQHSSKERAENVMIVDLLRNDLSKIAKPASVKTPQLLDCIALPTVWQMVSGISAACENLDLYDVFAALFPCGSITGAPKIAAIQKIQTLEVNPRSIYCGAIGLLSPDQALFNVAIRTLLLNGDTWSYGVGSGITIDSQAQSEWQEWQNKMQFLKKAT